MKNKRFILHVDMNSYFASVEQQANPFLRGKPLGVCAYLKRNGCIIASSIEAKKVGVRTGARVQDALKLCPDLKLVENEPAKYRSTTTKIFSIFSDYSETIEPYSIDEAFIDVTGHIETVEQGIEIIQEMRQRIKDEVGDYLKCSVGLSYTKWLAKFGSDMTGVDEHDVITRENLIERLSEADLMDAWGINVRINARLNALGIQSLVDLKNAQPHILIKHFGAYGYALWAHVNGIEISRVKVKKELAPKSIGHSYQVPAKDGIPANFPRLLMKMCEKAGRRMRKKGLSGTQIYFALGYKHEKGFHKSHRLSEEVYDTMSIYQAFMRLYGSLKPTDTITFMAVSIGGLKRVEWQQQLFDDRVRAKRLAQALDRINNTYGEFTMIHGIMYGTERSFRDRVGFRKTVDAEFSDENELTYDHDYH